MGIAQALDSMEHHTSAGSDGGSRLALASFCIFLGERGDGRLREAIRKLWAPFVPFASQVWGFASPGLSGYVRQALIVFLNRFPPCTLTWAPGFGTVGAEVASVVKIELITPRSFERFSRFTFSRKTMMTVLT